MSGQAIAISFFIVFAICVATVAYSTRWIQRRRAEDVNGDNGTRRPRTILDIFGARLERKPVERTGEELQNPSSENRHD